MVFTLCVCDDLVLLVVPQHLYLAPLEPYRLWARALDAIKHLEYVVGDVAAHHLPLYVGGEPGGGQLGGRGKVCTHTRPRSTSDNEMTTEARQTL